MCVYIEDPDVTRAATFASDVLNTERVITFLDNNFVVYGVEAHSAPAIQLSTHYRIRRLPAFVVVACTANNRIGVGAILNPTGPEELCNALAESIARADPIMEEEVQRLSQLRQAQVLREEQDAEYQNALLDQQLKADEITRQKQAEADRSAAAIRAEEEARAQETARTERLTQRLNSVPLPPAEGEPSVRVSFRLHDGSREERVFSPSNSINALYDYVGGTYQIEGFSLLTGHPKARIEPSDATLESAGLVNRCLIFVDLMSE